ncbi:Nif11-like leader peptide family natural product precursor [Ramlibacter terrae]|uniref:Nif11-like leader peptide family natural product n=1 Tax=Ramlibacter terrae TaxID=2732511 RepID=A0ABX6P1P7_9BURK|nr:Nif11-like leader peptide family natural product precursor [Ramlibacter terrae]
MSLKAVEEFRAVAASQPELQKSCATAFLAGDLQSVVRAGAARGYAFTEAEVSECLDKGELSDAELELVAGGGGNPACVFGSGSSRDHKNT